MFSEMGNLKSFITCGIMVGDPDFHPLGRMWKDINGKGETVYYLDNYGRREITNKRLMG